MTYEEFSSFFAGYCKPADGSDAAKTCPYPHPHKTTSHHGYDCKTAAKFFKDTGFSKSAKHVAELPPALVAAWTV